MEKSYRVKGILVKKKANYMEHKFKMQQYFGGDNQVSTTIKVEWFSHLGILGPSYEVPG